MCGYYVMRYMYEIVTAHNECKGDLEQVSSFVITLSSLLYLLDIYEFSAVNLITMHLLILYFVVF